MCSMRAQRFLTNDAIIYPPQSYLRLKRVSNKLRPPARRTVAIMTATGAHGSAATEHTEEAQLAELVNQEAGLTSEIELKVIRNELISYTFKVDGKEVNTQKVQVIFQSKIPEQYCLGVAKLQKRDTAGLKKIQDRFQTGTTCKYIAIKLLADKPAFVHTSVRITIDLRKSNAQAMLQSTSFPQAPVPTCTITDILQLQQMQRFDLMAIPSKIIDERKSGTGMRIIDVRLVDGSTKECSSDTEHEYASLPLTLFFKGDAELISFKEYVGRTPILFMALTGSRPMGKVHVSSVKDQTWWQPAAGAKCESMASRASEMCGVLAKHTDVASLQVFTPQAAKDYTNTVATLTACRLVDPKSLSQSPY